jgi:GT2 family glycosyltransferase
MEATVIIPFHRNLSQLSQSLAAARLSMPAAEIIVAADGAVDDCRPLAEQHRARVIDVPGPSGPAVARNRAAAVATGKVLLFVDADVVPAPDALPGLYRVLELDPAIAGVFGAYDLSPAETNFMSQYKNLAHSYVHQVGRKEAVTFWAGLSAMRTDVFRSVGGFDERFRRPSVEDIDLGYRVSQAGHRLRLAAEHRGRHLKRWTLWGSIVTEIRARGVPWAQLIHRFGALANDLNTRVGLRLSVVLAYLVVASLAAAFFTPWALAGALLSVAAIVALNWDYYRWFAKQRGLWFAVRVVPAHLVHHLCNGLSFVIGSGLYLATRLGLDLPWALPASPWTSTLAAASAPRPAS